MIEEVAHLALVLGEPKERVYTHCILLGLRQIQRSKNFKERARELSRKLAKSAR
jgi:hypothetical protein